jgi:hypothetical protein
MTRTVNTPKLLAGLATVAVVATAAVTVAGTGAAAAPGASSRTKTMTFVTKSTSFDVVDNAPAGAPETLSPGDLFIESEALSSKGRKVGRSDILSVAMGGQRVKSLATATLREGTIEFGGTIPRSDSFTLAITGGTGAYANARGTAAITSGETSGRTTLSIIR